MARSHPPTLLRLVERSLRDDIRPERGAHVLCAVSGGPDSMALAHCLARLAPRLDLVVSVAAIDHGLRAEATDEVRLAEALATQLGLPFAARTLAVSQGGNLQARARRARREALIAMATERGATLIATGHHADDRAETLILRLLRGAGPRGLAVLPPRDDPWIRPMIRARREDVLRHLARHQVAHATDPSNHDKRFVRTRVRHEVMPLLEALSPGVVGHLNALADQLREGAPPSVADASGRLIPLGRAHISLIRGALREQRRQTVPLGGGRVLCVEGKSGDLSVESADVTAGRAGSAGATRPEGPLPSARRVARNQRELPRTSGGAKRHKSG